MRSMSQCYACNGQTKGGFPNYGTLFRLCRKCYDILIYHYKRRGPRKYATKEERDRARPEEARLRHLRKLGITERKCEFCGTTSHRNGRGEEVWKYNFEHTKCIGMLCGRCDRRLYPLERDKIMHSHEYYVWEYSVMKRDGFRCMICKFSRPVYRKRQQCYDKTAGLAAHHIKSFSKFPELRFDIDNGQTLCIQCHKRSHKRK